MAYKNESNHTCQTDNAIKLLSHRKSPTNHEQSIMHLEHHNIIQQLKSNLHHIA